ncbi:uncharacterized protein LOC127286076 [Leptopilina boulardi]|uniref:uncharacterized protein LOC127286076 n=1 Tax=Leptopilina boulardi TaxID=63433 RepID=UPI0021F5338A|nr:uncharacterized protein LOC127286076 [Leptopilina boulardi]
MADDIDPSKVIIPPLHTKLGAIKQFVKALDKKGNCFKYLEQKFPEISDAKLKEGVFDGPRIRKLLKDEQFITKMNKKEKAAWLSFKAVVENFLGNHKSENWEQIVSDMIKTFGKLGCLMSIKLHYLDSHRDQFPENLGDYSEEQGERFHQDLKEFERRYQGRWDVNMMADYSWMLKRDIVPGGTNLKRKPLHKSFEDKRVRYHKKT